MKGRLGLSTARVPQGDRHGLLWLSRGKLSAVDGNLSFATAGADGLTAGVYEIPFQTISALLLGPGTTVSHDALRLLARHQTGMLAVGAGGVRLYAVSMPHGPDRSALARRQATLWADPDRRTQIARQMYAIRFGELLPQRDLNALRGIEGQRMKKIYRNLAERYGVQWKGRRYDRSNPEGDDAINRAINHAATAVYAASRIAVAVTGAIPQLGFIHESSGHAFALDVADLFRADVTLPIAFEATSKASKSGEKNLERYTRGLAGRKLQSEKVIPKMIDQIQKVLDVDDDRSDQECAPEV